MSKLRAISSTAIATMALGGSMMIVAPAAHAQAPVSTSSDSSTSATSDYQAPSSPAPRKVTSSASNTSGSVTFGTRSEAVRSLQQKLTAAGYDVPATGYFGTITRGALERFQADNGLTVTGRATARTLSALGDAQTSDSDESSQVSASSDSSSARTLTSSRSVTSSASSSAAQAAVNYAYGAIGSSYVYGGTGNGGYDCSGLTSAAWASAGVNIPRTSYAQWSGLQSVSTSNLQPGDLVIYYGGGHVGIYVGDGMIIHSSRPGKPVAKVAVDSMPIAGAVRPA
ncbi:MULTISPECIES: C40 family peptidase [unclassified Luteococcus]|uniref:C40 family peptidase n=1 Tax=unclassified Luteococcus TaxID=2639923 RepID=UPI00313D6079